MTMDEVDQKQQEDITRLQGQDKVHTLLIKMVGIGFFALILMMMGLIHVVLTQKIYIEGRDCPEVRSVE